MFSNWEIEGSEELIENEWQYSNWRISELLCKMNKMSYWRSLSCEFEIQLNIFICFIFVFMLF